MVLTLSRQFVTLTGTGKAVCVFFSTYGVSFSPLENGYKATKIFVSGWLECFGGQDTYWVTKMNNEEKLFFLIIHFCDLGLAHSGRNMSSA